jgi:hypothetical protein
MHTRGVWREEPAPLTRRTLLGFLAAAAIPEKGMRRIDPPALAGSGMPFLATGADGAVYLSWIDTLPGKAHALRFSRWTGDAWTAPETIAQGRNWFVNWADFPALAVRADGSLLAHWLTRSGEGSAYGYGVRVAHRDPRTRQWRQIHGMSLEEKVDYAGFLTFTAGGNAAVYLSPPAEQASRAGGDSHEHGEDHRKTVRVIRFHPDGRVGEDREIDADACSCCQTAIGETRRGLILAYRDRLPGEIRDIAVVRCVDGVWSKPVTVHGDGWKINGCPTDGPGLVAAGDHVAVTWLTRAGGSAKVLVAQSTDAGASFAAPARVDGGNPLGRPAIVAFDEDSYLLLWLEKAGIGVEMQMRRLSRQGKLYPPVSFGKAPLGRESGFPKVAISGQQVLLAWRDAQVRAATLTKTQFKQMEQR